MTSQHGYTPSYAFLRDVSMDIIRETSHKINLSDKNSSKKVPISQKVLSFFRKSAREYSDIPGMSAEARKAVRTYKKLFDTVSEQNQGNNALSIELKDAGMKKSPVTSTIQDNVQVTGEDDEEKADVTGADVDTDTRHAIKYLTSPRQIFQAIWIPTADMEAVAIIDASKLEKTGKKPFDLFLEYFDAIGNNIASSTFGDVALNRASVKSEIRHGITAEKVAALEAIPAVIEQGKVIFSKKKPGTDVDRIVIAAPIKIGDADYYMGVMLQRDMQNQRLYLHNVVAIKAEEATTLSQDDSLTNWSDESDSRLFISTILQKAINVKMEKQKSANNPTEISSKKVPTEKMAHQLQKLMPMPWKKSAREELKRYLTVRKHGSISYRKSLQWHRR